MTALLARILASPLVVRVLVPAAAKAATDFFERWAKRFADSAAFREAADAKTPEEMSAASEDLSDLTGSRPGGVREL